MTIIVADDEYYTRKALTQCIANALSACGSAGDKILECDGAQAVLELVEQQPVDLVFTDIRMGEMSGLSLCERLRQQHPAMHLVIISGYAEFRYAQQAIQSGVFRYLLKPVDEGEIRAVIRDLLANPSGARPVAPAHAGACPPMPSSSTIEPVSQLLDAISRKLIDHYLTNGRFVQLQELVLSLWAKLEADRLEETESRAFLQQVLWQICQAAESLPQASLLRREADPALVDSLSDSQAQKDYFCQLLGRLADIFPQEEGSQQEVVHRLICFIEEHYSEELNLYDIAQNQFFVHPNYLSKLLKDKSGVSFSKYLLDVRMKNAVLLLNRRDLSVSTIAQLVGYNSESYFVQVFHRYYGSTPGVYRKNLWTGEAANPGQED